MYIRDIITKKREKENLTEDEIKFVIQGYFKDEISDAQMAALMTAIHISGINEKEILYLVNSMAETGEELEFYRVSNKITDIHTLGGISDKIILILISIIHSLGYPVAKVIGRELGMEDRLIALPQYSLEKDIEKFKKNISEKNIGILKSIRNLAPIEKKLYRLRHQIACDNNMGLIATSIMSQKIALGFSNIFFEITYGENAYVKNLSDAKVLARYLTSIGKKKMRNIGCCVTPLNEPVGRTFGNIIELREIYKFLSGESDREVEEIILEYGSNILNISKFCTDINKSKRLIKETIKNGKALESFKKLIILNGGDYKILENDIKVKYKIPVMSISTGYISEIDINQLRQLAQYLDAIRMSELDKLDVGAGIVFEKKVGDIINTGEIIAYIYTNNDTKIEEAVSWIKRLIKVQDKKIKDLSRVKFNINNL